MLICVFLTSVKRITCKSVSSTQQVYSFKAEAVSDLLTDIRMQDIRICLWKQVLHYSKAQLWFMKTDQPSAIVIKHRNFTNRVNITVFQKSGNTVLEAIGAPV